MIKSNLVIPLVLLLGGCATPAGIIFPSLENAPHWPAAPEPTRIRYIGQLSSSADLKPAVSTLEAVGQALFGKKSVHTMLTPYAICTDGGDRVFVADSNAQVVHVFDLERRRYQRWQPARDAPFAQPIGLAYDTVSQRLLVTDSVGAAMYTFTTDGTLVGRTPTGVFVRPTGVCFDPISQRVFVADTGAHQIVVLSLDGQIISRIGGRGTELGQFNFPTNVAVDAEGFLYVCDSLNFRMQRFSPALQPLRQIGSQGNMPGYFSQPKGLACDSHKHLYVVDAQFEAVQIFSSTGELLLNLGKEGTNPGEFWLPAGICIDPQDRIWIADVYNRRVQVFQYVPEAQP